MIIRARWPPAYAGDKRKVRLIPEGSDWLLAEDDPPRRLHRWERWLFGLSGATSVRLQFGQMFLRPSAKPVQWIN
jgi:hypothetical protein